jgi:hypothetical protein
MTRAQAWLFIASGLAGLLAVSIASGKEHWGWELRRAANTCDEYVAAQQAAQDWTPEEQA